MRIQSVHASLRGLATALLILLAATDADARGQQIRPFYPVETATAAALQKRDGCIANYYDCAVQSGSAYNGVCCANGQVCGLDASNQPACCPAGAVCTGVAPSNWVPPATTAPVSYVPNTYFSFAYITTSFANRAACSAALDQCSRNQDVCRSQLQAQIGFGITIVVPGGGGTTIGATGTNLGTAAATSVCSSLSSVACLGLQPTVCATKGTNGIFYVGSANAAPARPTPPPPAIPLAHMALGVGLGMLRAL